MQEVITLLSHTQWSDLNRSISGILSLPDGPLLVSIRPVLTSLNEGPSPGFIVFGRWLNLQEIQRLADINHLKLSLYLLNAQNLPQDIEQIKSQILINPHNQSNQMKKILSDMV